LIAGVFGVFSLIPWVLSVNLDVWFAFATAGYAGSLGIFGGILSVDSSIFLPQRLVRIRRQSLEAIHRKWVQLLQVFAYGFIGVVIGVVFQAKGVSPSSGEASGKFLLAIVNTAAAAYLVLGYVVLILGTVMTKLMRIEELLAEREI
jgi:hypothetical protein